jgi:hypothetical protein
MIRFTCPDCDAPIKVSDDAGGKTLSCPKCKAKVGVPAADVEVVSEWQPAPAAPRLDRSVKPPPREEVEPEPKPRRSKKPDVQLVDQVTRFSLTRIARMIAWVICGVLVLGEAASHGHALAKAESAIQQAAVSAASCFGVIVTYVITRAFTEFFAEK